MLVALHVPKCAGTSLRGALLQALGEEAVYLDYNESPFNPDAAPNREGAAYFPRHRTQGFGFLHGRQAVYGHFHPAKYLALQDARWMTVLREPVERLVSHYYFWLKLAPHGHTLHDRFLQEQPSLAGFAQWPSLRRFYSDVFFSGMDMQKFQCIGEFSRMHEVERFLRRNVSPGFTLPPARHNANPHDAYAARRQEVLADEALMRTLRGLLVDDIAFYERWAGRGCA